AFSMSLDGYVAGPEVSVEHPMGRGGDRLHEWMFTDHPDRAADEVRMKESFARNGATVVGRRTFIPACRTGTTRRPIRGRASFSRTGAATRYRPGPPASHLSMTALKVQCGRQRQQ